MSTKFLGSLFFIITIFGCSPKLSLNRNSYLRNNELNEVKLPFEENDFPSNNLEFFQIVNTKNSSLNIAKQRAQTSAKVLLSQQIDTYIVTVGTQRLSFKSSSEREIFNLKSRSFSVLLVNNLKLVDSKIYKSKTGEYEYWAVYSLKLNEVEDLNKSQTIFSSNEFNKTLKNTLTPDINLEASIETQPNNYHYINGDEEKDLRDKIEIESKAYLGIPYVWGGNTPSEGFDCSGFVRWVYKKSLNKLIPRTTLEQSREFKNIIKSNIEESNTGDLIYFKTIPNREISHVGIYLDQGKFIHAPNEREKVKIDELKGYWLENYVGYASASNLK